MSTEETQQSRKLGMSTRRALLLVLIVGLGVGVVAYSIGDTLAANAAQSAQTTQTNSAYPAFGPRGWEGGYHGQWLNRTGTRLSFRAVSTVSNVSITGFNIVDPSHISVTLAWTGTGSAPALTIVSAAPGLSGSNTLAAGWGTTTTVSISMVGTGALSSTSTCLRVLVVPFTGP
jgi:hypothetical protein